MNSLHDPSGPGGLNPGANNEPLYNIGVVTRVTGISMATLRAWERRYDFPESHRTAGGHRLYSEWDIQRLLWVKDRIEEGMQTAQAIHALRFQEEKGLSVQEGRAAVYHPPAPEEIKPALPGYEERLFEALSRSQLEQADQALGEALAASSPEDLILKVISPVMARIGEAWERRKISVTTEHFATNYLRQRLLMWMLSGPPPYSRAPITLACAPQEWHEGSLLILGALLRRRRWPVAYLGQNVPLSDLASFVNELKPSLVVMVAMTEESAGELAAWPQWMPETAQKGTPPIGFGGRVFTQKPEWRVRVPGIFLGETFEEGLENIERLLR